MAKRGKIVALSSAAVGLVTLIAAGVATKDRFFHGWYLRKLETGTNDEMIHAARRLDAMRSVDAVPKLVQAMRRACNHWNCQPSSLFTNQEPYCVFLETFHSIGERAVPALLDGLGDDNPAISFFSLNLLLFVLEKPPQRLWRNWWRTEDLRAAVPRVQNLARDETQRTEVRIAAALTLAKIQGTQDEPTK